FSSFSLVLSLSILSGKFGQVAPGTSIEERPTEGKVPHPGTWYEEGIHYGKNSTLNKWFYGVLLEHDLPGKR
ncbi:unnamed protein product, partial [Ectocarpus sp. 12 AP-2014]